MNVSATQSTDPWMLIPLPPQLLRTTACNFRYAYLRLSYTRPTNTAGLLLLLHSRSVFSICHTHIYIRNMKIHSNLLFVIFLTKIWLQWCPDGRIPIVSKSEWCFCICHFHFVWFCSSALPSGWTGFSYVRTLVVEWEDHLEWSRSNYSPFFLVSDHNQLAEYS